MTSYPSIPKILIVDDRPANLVAMKKMLSAVTAELVFAGSGNEALALTLQYKFALCLLDVMMPEMDGFETADLMRQNDATMGMPIIFVTAMDKSDKHIFQGYASGAVDYLYKPVIKEILLAKVRVFLELECRLRELHEANEFIAAQNRQLEIKASKDGLTGLDNHAHFQKLCKREFDLAIRHNNNLTILLCDIDYFKDVNDTYGHQVGDEVLKGFAGLLKGLVRDTDLLARYGGEEFILALPNTDLAGGNMVAEKIRCLSENHRYWHEKTSFNATVSIGVATRSLTQKHPHDLIEQADAALYQAKASGRNLVVCYNGPQGRKKVEQRAVSLQQVRGPLQAALEKNKAAALASFDALVHSNLKNFAALKVRNDKALKLINRMGERLHLSQEILESCRRSFKFHDLFRVFINDPTLGNSQRDNLRTEQRANLENLHLIKELTDFLDYFSVERQILLHHYAHNAAVGGPVAAEADVTALASRLFALVDCVVSMSLSTAPGTPVAGQALIAAIREQSGEKLDPMLMELVVEILESEDL